ncbi:MAG: hypothetical protein KKH44_10580 [Bacteroidetes bacterium]|nr:hypothetical protein [Bacteroidota bacterium]
MDRFWVGGSGTWSSTNTTNWASVSGGAGGASVPVYTDDVFLDANSGAATITVENGAAYTKSLDCTGFTGTLTPSLGSVALFIYGGLTLSAGMTIGTTPNPFTWWIRGTGNITTAGHTLYEVIITGTGITATLQDTLTLNYRLTLLEGTFDANDQDINIPAFITYGSNTRALTMGSGTWTCTGVGLAWNISTTTNLTITPETSTIKYTNNSATSKHFIGGGKTYYNLWIATADTGITTIVGSNTFNDIKADAGRTLYLAAGTTQTCATITMTGTPSDRITLQSDSAGSTATLAVTTPTMERVDCKDIIGTTGTFLDYSGFDDGNNTGIRFLFKDPANLYSSDDVYATCDAASGVIGMKISKDNGSNWSAAKEKTFVAGEATQTYGSPTDNWGIPLVGSDMDDGNFKVRIYCGTETGTYSDYKTFGFSITAGLAINGIEITMEAKWDGALTSLDEIQVNVYYGTSVVTVQAGAQAYASDARKNGEGAGSGTGALVFYDGAGNWVNSVDGTVAAA